MKNGKVVGVDGILLEILKNEGLVLFDKFYRFLFVVGSRVNYYKIFAM